MRHGGNKLKMAWWELMFRIERGLRGSNSTFDSLNLANHILQGFQMQEICTPKPLFYLSEKSLIE